MFYSFTFCCILVLLLDYCYFISFLYFFPYSCLLISFFSFHPRLVPLTYSCPSIVLFISFYVFTRFLSFHLILVVYSCSCQFFPFLIFHPVLVNSSYSCPSIYFFSFHHINSNPLIQFFKLSNYYLNNSCPNRIILVLSFHYCSFIPFIVFVLLFYLFIYS